MWRLDTSMLTLKARFVPDNKHVGIEPIDIKGSSSHSLNIVFLEVTSEPKALVVVGDIDDSVNIGMVWIAMG